MWKHGINPFFLLLTYRPPATLDQMLVFMYIAYFIMVFLYEIVPEFEEIWIECLARVLRHGMDSFLEL
ncbi:hypothetical protein BKA64DRAFT_672317 [Cadophora sp. MPI-SDFR-AT-0126]|nr:hypothetical protein BKA64DRAFT_672317 [Leotiomycetes sp. MPI-SDFR-AT-0126]